MKIMWKPYVPSKVSFFAWKAWWGKVLPMKQLKKRGYHLPSICPFCRKEEDNLEHMLIHCSPIWELWTSTLSVKGVIWVCPFMIKDLFYTRSRIPVKKNGRKLWWAIYAGQSGKRRTKIVFEDVPFSHSRLKHSIISFMFCGLG